MNIFYLSIIVSVIILIPYSSSQPNSQCLYRDLYDNYDYQVKNENGIFFDSSYTGEDIPNLSKSNITYNKVSYTYIF